MGRTSIRAAALICIALLAGCTSEKPVAKTPLRIGIDPWPGYAYAYLAREKGFFDANGVKVELVMKKNTVESGAAFAGRELDGFFGLFSDMILANANGVPARFVYAVDHSTTGDAVVARPSVRSLRGLKGKTVGFEGVNTFSHMFVLKLLEKVGLDETNVRFRNVAGPDVLKALEGGQIDAGHTWNPTRLEATRKGYRVLAVGGDLPGVIVDGLIIGPGPVKERPDDVRRFVKSLLQAREYLHAHRDEAVGIMAAAEGMPKEAMEDGVAGCHHYDLKENARMMGKGDGDGTLRKAHRTAADFFLKRGQMSRVPAFEEVVEPRFVTELGAEENVRP